jgi:hypothetical protein
VFIPNSASFAAFIVKFHTHCVFLKSLCPAAQMSGLLKFLIFAAFPFGALASILPLTYKSGSLKFNDWISLFTLCFAPLVAHVLAGVPTIVYLSQDRPNWRQKLVLYNPTTILWRYFVIADRRLRAKRWNAADMASSNVYFWTCVGWDGSEASIRKSQAYCVSLPQRKHTNFVSWSTVKTLIVTLQGADSLYYLIWSNFIFSTADTYSFAVTASVGSLFSPLTILGLLRLVACFWLTEDFVYINCEEVQTTVTRLNAKTEQEQERTQLVPMHIRAHKPPTTIDETLGFLGAGIGEGYRSPSTWQSWLLRTLFLLPIIALVILCSVNLIPGFYKDNWYTATFFGILLFYDIFLINTVVIIGYYFIRCRNTTTVLPSISSIWYQFYTGMIFLLMLVLIIIASLETWKSPCGFYTTYPTGSLLCGNAFSSTKNITNGVFGIAIIGNTTIDLGFDLVQPQGAMSLLYFDGSCQGLFYENENSTGLEGFQFVNTSDPNFGLPYVV